MVSSVSIFLKGCGQSQLLNDYAINYDNFIQITDDELLMLYRKAHIVPFLSTFEGFGLPILEGQSQNCVILTSNIEPMLDVAGKGAVFVNPFNIESIKVGFLEIISNTELQQLLIREGIENIKRFDVKVIANQYIELYREVLLHKNDI
jgi:glycosyltransferase involved in cell wall biosynthesis